MKYLLTTLAMVCVNVIMAQDLSEGLKEYKHLLGEFNIEVMLPTQTGGWQKGGEGQASFTTILGGKFIEENVATTFGNTTMTMKNAIGIDPRDNGFRLVAMDKEYGSMDMYQGEKKGKDLIFTNLNSDKRFETPDGSSLAFKLNFLHVDEDTHELLVEFTRDEGKTWLPYAKNIYKRKS